MKLEVGQFVRTKSGYICKIINVNDFREPNMKYGVEANYLKDVMFIGNDDIVKGSYNIIDVLEVGDYVNGYYVEDVLKAFVNVAVGSNYFQSPTIYEKDIKSVVTKERFENMKYRIGDE